MRVAGLALPSGIPIVAPYGWALGTILLGLLLPMGIGMVVRHRWPQQAIQMATPTLFNGTVAFVALVVVHFTQRQAAIASLDVNALAAMLGFIVLCMASWMADGWPRSGEPTRACDSEQHAQYRALPDPVQFSAPGGTELDHCSHSAR
jgi:predicted Na+-dependent transporter